MKKEFGILALLLALCAAVAFMNPKFLLAINLENTTALVGMYGIFSIGLGFVIITGGIDLSVGSLFALQGVMLGIMLGTAPWPFAAGGVSWLWLTLGLVVLAGGFVPRGWVGDSERWLWWGGGALLLLAGLAPLVVGGTQGMPWWLAGLLLLVGTMILGLTNGLLITRAHVQPFIVTLCGLLIYRGAARYIAGDSSVGFGTGQFGVLRSLQEDKLPAVPVPFILLGGLVLLLVFAAVWFVRRRDGERRATLTPLAFVTLVGLALYALLTIALLVGFFALTAVDPREIDNFSNYSAVFRLLSTERYATPMPTVLLIGVALAAAVLLHGSVYGRYLYAVGRNEEATRYSGVNTKRVIAAAYVISAALAALSGLLFAFYANAITPASHGSFYELFGIAAAVLGGCSLRGGEGTIFGIVLGAALIQVLQNFVNLLGLPSSLNFAVMGGVILAGVLADQVLSARKGRRRGSDSGLETVAPEAINQGPAGTGAAQSAVAATE